MQQKNFENRSSFAEVVINNQVGCFSMHCTHTYKFERVVFEICRQTDRQTDKLMQYLASRRSKSNKKLKT